MEQERVAAMVLELECPLQRVVVVNREGLAAPRASVATQAPALVSEVPMAFEAEFPPELRVVAWPEEMAGASGLQVTPRVEFLFRLEFA